MIKFILNNTEINTSLAQGSTVLDFIRYEQNLVGTKIGCREGDCGACTIMVGTLLNNNIHYHTVTSCLTPLINMHGKHVVTIEGLSNSSLSDVQKAFVQNNASQCGFCTPGFIMSLTCYFTNQQNITEEKAIASMDGNICRCTGYKSIIQAAKMLVNNFKQNNKQNVIQNAVEQNIVPNYFNTISERLAQIEQTISTNTNATMVVSGGTDLLVQKHQEVEDSTIFTTKSINQNFIEESENEIIISANTTISQFLQSPIIKKYFPKIDDIGKLVSSTPIRNMATFAGNFINASPIGDFTIFFLVLQTKLHFVHLESNQKRTVLLSNFYKNYKVIDKQEKEVLTSFTFLKPTINSFFHFEKVSKRTHLDIASVNTAAYYVVDNNIISQCSISAGGVSPIPMLLQKTSNYFVGKKIQEIDVNEVNILISTEIKPISDARGTVFYKTLLLRQLIKIHFGLA